MKRKLYFYIWASPDFERNIAVLTHKACLKRYIGVFDEINFIAAVDDYPSIDGDLLKAIAFIKDVCGDREYNLTMVKNDPNTGEFHPFCQTILPLIAKGDDEMVFYGHIKGISDVNMPFRNAYSVLRWSISMYYYSLEHIADAEEKLKNGYSAYGSLLTHFEINPGVALQNHNKFYLGTFYWINPRYAHDNLYYNSVPNEFKTRFLSENFPMLLKEESLASYNMVCTENTVADLYFLRKENWPRYLSYYGDSDILYKIQNEIITEICGNEGY